jgi:hypothetical protein
MKKDEGEDVGEKKEERRRMREVGGRMKKENV